MSKLFYAEQTPLEDWGKSWWSWTWSWKAAWKIFDHAPKKRLDCNRVVSCVGQIMGCRRLYLALCNLFVRSCVNIYSWLYTSTHILIAVRSCLRAARNVIEIRKRLRDQVKLCILNNCVIHINWLNITIPETKIAFFIRRIRTSAKMHSSECIKTWLHQHSPFCKCVISSRDAGERGIAPLLFQKGGNVGGGAFS